MARPAPALAAGRRDRARDRDRHRPLRGPRQHAGVARALERRELRAARRTTTCASTCSRGRATCAPGRLERGARAIRAPGVVRAARGAPDRADPGRRLAAPGARVLVPGQLVGHPAAARGAAVDALAAVRGRRACGRGDARRDGRGARPQLRRALRPAGPRARSALAGAGAVRYVGQGLSPEYFLVTGPGRASAARPTSPSSTRRWRAAQRAAPSARAGERAGARGSRRAPTSSRAERGLRAALARALPGRRRDDHARAHEEPPTASSTRTRAATSGSSTSSPVCCWRGAAFAAFNLISRVVESQRREIGIGMALGVPPRAAGAAPAPDGRRRSRCSAWCSGSRVGRRVRRMAQRRVREQLPLPTYATPFQRRRLPEGAALGLPAAAGRDRVPGLARGARAADRGDPGRLPRRQGRRVRAAAEADPAARVEPCPDAAAQRGARAAPHDHDDRSASPR